MNELPALIGQLGFPIAITVWLLYERYKILNDMKEVLNDLHESIKELTIYLKEKGD